MSKSVITQYGNSKEVLKFNEFVSMSVIVSDTGITANADGKKIVPAGTIVGGSSKAVLANRDEPVSAKNTAEAEGILLTDTDVTYGPAAGAMVIFGFIDSAKLPEAPTAEAVTALNMIKFIA